MVLGHGALSMYSEVSRLSLWLFLPSSQWLLPEPCHRISTRNFSLVRLPAARVICARRNQFLYR